MVWAKSRLGMRWGATNERAHVMATISRRSLLAATVATAAVGAIPFPIWFERQAKAQDAVTRYNLQTPAGTDMAAQYAAAVKILMTMPESDPRSWTFWWYTHWVKGSTTKEAELARIFPDPADPRRALALESWNTCQPHGTGMDRMMFLPWHRMFVYFYERLIRSALNNPAFTLPYWNYSPDSAFPYQRPIPPEFRKRTDPLYGALYRSAHRSGINSGNPIDLGQESAGRLNLALSLSQKTYLPQGTIPGFCNRLNSHVHGNVHTLVGNSLGMASVKYAGNDPLFWVHHSNIDRIWESWNKAGFANPTSDTWLNKSFVFADELGQRVVATVRDFVDPAVLGYGYDALESVPPPPPPPVAVASVQLATSSESSIKPRTAAVARKLALGARPSRALLQPVDARQGSFSDRVRNLPAGHRLYLVLEDLFAETPPEVVYDVYLNLAPGASAKDAMRHHVGDLNFFEAVGHESHGPGGAFFSYDITDLALGLLANKRIGFNAIVTIVPAGRPAVSARPTIGKISIVEQ
jgi:tyrosinase